MLDIIASYHCTHFQGKLMNQTSENGKKHSFRFDFGPFGPNSGCQISFFKNVASSVTRYHDQLSLCIILEKTNHPILRKLSDGRTDGWMDESDFIGPVRLMSSV